MIPPWTVPPDFLRYMQAGAETGLSAGRLAQAGQQAAAHIALAGQQLASENERAKERNALTQQDLVQTLLERSRSADLMKQFHDAEIGERMRHNLAVEGKPVPGTNSKVWHVGDSLVALGPDGKPMNLYTAPTLDPFLKSEYNSHLKRRQTAEAALSNPDLKPDQKQYFQSILDDANSNLTRLRSKGVKSDNAQIPTTAGTTPDQAFGFDPRLRTFGGEGGLFPSVNPNVLAPIPAGGGLPDTPQLIWDHKTGTLQPAQ